MRSGRLVVGVGVAGAGAGPGLDPHPVAVLDEGLDARRRQGDAVLARPGLPRDPDVHGSGRRAGPRVHPTGERLPR